MAQQRDSPLFSEVLLWLEKDDIQKLGKVFPLREWIVRRRDDDSIIGKKLYWDTLKHKKWLSHIDLDDFRTKLKTELVDPLFLRPGINIKDEDGPSRHNIRNLFCLTKILHRDLMAGRDLKKAIEAYHRDLQRFFPDIMNPKFPPLYWALGRDNEEWERDLKKSLDELNEKVKKTWEICKNLADERLESTFQKWREFLRERDEDFLALRHVRPEYIKRELAIEEVCGMLKYLRAARGKPGRHPKPFNVFIYHLINRCTKWKLDKNRKYVMRRDGQHRLERDWDLILFLLLDTHLHRVKLSEIDLFISQNKKKTVARALRVLKKRLWDIYKNFPPLHGWSMQREGVPRPATGFRKLIVGDDGKLQIVSL